jgi:hypothetical protein
MPQLHLHRSELTYEGVLSQPLGAVIDTPGRFVSAFLSEFNHLDVGVPDVAVDHKGPIEDYGISCDVERLDANIVLRVDRIEICCPASNDAQENAAKAIRGAWKAVSSITPEIVAKSHSLLFEMDCEIRAGSYRALLERFCRPHGSLPPGTETAVVYYLPQDDSQGLLDSNLVLNRSAEVDGGILIAVTLVFDGKDLSPDRLVHAGHARLQDLLKSLDITPVRS